MKNLKYLIPALLLLTIIAMGFANSNQYFAAPNCSIPIDENLNLSIDWTQEINRNHPYRAQFSAKDVAYWNSLYQSAREHQQRKVDASGSTKVYRYSQGNNSLVFSILKDGQIVLDTLRNVVHPANRKGHSAKVPKLIVPNVLEKILHGSLPDGVHTYQQIGNRKHKYGIQLPTPQYVKIEITDLNHKVLHTLTDGQLKSGWNHFSWRVKNKFRDGYLLKYQVEDQVRIHRVNL